MLLVTQENLHLFLNSSSPSKFYSHSEWASRFSVVGSSTPFSLTVMKVLKQIVPQSVFWFLVCKGKKKMFKRQNSVSEAGLVLSHSDWKQKWQRCHGKLFWWASLSIFAKPGDEDQLFSFSELSSKSDMQLQITFFQIVSSQGAVFCLVTPAVFQFPNKFCRTMALCLSFHRIPRRMEARKYC